MKKLKFYLDDKMIKHCTVDQVGNFETFVYSHVFGESSIQYLKICN